MMIKRRSFAWAVVMTAALEGGTWQIVNAPKPQLTQYFIVDGSLQAIDAQHMSFTARIRVLQRLPQAAFITMFGIPQSGSAPDHSIPVLTAVSPSGNCYRRAAPGKASAVELTGLTAGQTVHCNIMFVNFLSYPFNDQQPTFTISNHLLPALGIIENPTPNPVTYAGHDGIDPSIRTRQPNVMDI